MIRNIQNTDIAAVMDIYNYYVLNTIVSFEEKPVDLAYMTEWVNRVTQKFPWLVYEEENKILGYAYASEWNKRSGYRFSVESSVYLLPNVTGQGIGSKLYEKLIEIIKKGNYHVVIGGISLSNAASVALHEKFGYEKSAHYKEVGFKFDKWIDVGYWELILKENA